MSRKPIRKIQVVAALGLVSVVVTAVAEGIEDGATLSVLITSVVVAVGGYLTRSAPGEPRP